MFITNMKRHDDADDKCGFISSKQSYIVYFTAVKCWDIEFGDQVHYIDSVSCCSFVLFNL